MQKQNKYNYLAVIQQHYGQGWEDAKEYGKENLENFHIDMIQWNKVPAN